MTSFQEQLAQRQAKALNAQARQALNKEEQRVMGALVELDRRIAERCPSKEHVQDLMLSTADSGKRLTLVDEVPGFAERRVESKGPIALAAEYAEQMPALGRLLRIASELGVSVVVYEERQNCTGQGRSWTDYWVALSPEAPVQETPHLRMV